MDIYKIFVKGYGFLNITCFMVKHYVCHYMYMNIVTLTMLHC
jgi:hypothetical protein